jgi:hypothetical protein
MVGRMKTKSLVLGVAALACAHAPVALATTPDYTPLYPNGTPVTEQIQYSEADGTLVTRMGMRPVGRHAREPWDNTAGLCQAKIAGTWLRVYGQG